MLFLLPSEDMGKVKNKPQNFKDEKSAIWQILHDTLLFSNCMYVHLIKMTLSHEVSQLVIHCSAVFLLTIRKSLDFTQQSYAVAPIFTIIHQESIELQK